MFYSESAQKAISQIISTMRATWNLDQAISEALRFIVESTTADRGIVVLVMGTTFKVTHECLEKFDSSLLGQSLDLMESTALTLNLLSHSDSAYINVDSGIQTQLTWSALFKLTEGLNSNLLLPFKAHCVLIGFLALQSQRVREWPEDQVDSAAKVVELLSVLLHYERQSMRDAYRDARRETNSNQP